MTNNSKSYSSRLARRYAACSAVAFIGMLTSFSGIVALVWGGHMIQFAWGLSAPVQLTPSYAIGCALAMAVGIVAMFVALAYDLIAGFFE